MSDAEPAPAGSLRAAIREANRRAREASATNPLVLSFASALGGGNLLLANNLPELTADHVRITVLGSNDARRVTLDCANVDAALLISGDDCRFEYLSFKEGGGRTTSGDTVMLLGARDARFWRCDFVDGWEAGINLIAAGRAVFDECLFANNGRRFGPGILCHDAADGLVVTRSTFRDHPGSAVALAGVRGAQFADCRFERNKAGLVLAEFCRDIVIGPRTTLRDHSDVGVAAANVIGLRIEESDFAATTAGTPMVSVLDARDTIVRRSRFTPIGGAAVHLERCQDSELSENFADGAAGGTFGLLLLDSPRTRLFLNVCRSFASDGFKAVGCEQLLVGPGNAAVRNRGRGFSLEGRGGARARVTVQSSSAIHSVSAGFLLLDVIADVTNVTAAGNEIGLSVHGQTSADVANSLFAENLLLDRHIAAGSATMNWSAYRRSQGNFGGGQGNYVGGGSGFARLVNLGGDDVHLLGDSPLIDRGTNVPPAGLPAADLDLDQRVRRGTTQRDVVDIGADEWRSGSPNPDATSLIVIGGALRRAADGLVPLLLDGSPRYANTPYLLLLSAAGTSPGIDLPGDPLIALQPDPLTYAFLTHPLAVGWFDGSGHSLHPLPLPGDLLATLGLEVTAVFVTADVRFASNPVGVRFLR